MRGCWRLNINFIFWPHCYDLHVVSFLFSWWWGPLHRGFSKGPLGRVWLSLPHLVSNSLGSAGNCIGGFPSAPSVGCGFPYHISSLTLWGPLATASGVSEVPPGRVWPSLLHLVSNPLGVCWQLHRGFPSAPSVGCGLPYHIWSLLSGTLLATALAPQTQLS